MVRRLNAILTLLLLACAIMPLLPAHAESAESWVVHSTADAGGMERGPNLLANPGFEAGSGNWISYGAGFSIDSTVKRSGSNSARLQGSSVGAAVQEVRLNQTVAGPIYVTGWSKADSVTPGCRMQYSLYLDILYTDGSQGYSQWVCFAGGTHGWQAVDHVIEPTKPVRSVYLWTMFQTDGSGKAWFDDLAVGAFGGDLRDFDGVHIVYGPPESRPWEGSAVRTIETGDGLSLGMTAYGGAIASLAVDGVEQIEGSAVHSGGFFVRDVAAGGEFVHLGGTVTKQSGALHYQGSDVALGLALDAQLTPGSDHVLVDVALEDTRGEDRAISLYFALPIAPEGRIWWQDIRTGYPADAVNESTFALDTTRRWGDVGWVDNDGFGANGLWSHYPLSSLGGEVGGSQDISGLALAYPMDRPVVSRFVYNAATAQYFSVFELGLSPEARHPGRAEVRFLIYRHDPEWGFRAAFAKYVDMYPEFFQDRVANDGVWVAHAELDSIPDIDDFHIRFHETGNASVYDEDDALGIYTLRYLTEPWGYWLRPPTSVDTGDYFQVMAYVQEMASSASAANDRRWGEAILSSGSFDDSGLYRFEASDQPFASHAAAFILNADPDLDISPYASTKATQSWSDNRQEPYEHPEWGILDGEYIDSFESKGLYANYRAEHWSASDLPLTYSTVNNRVTLPHIFSSYELAKWIASDIHARDRYVMGNSLLLRYGFPAHLFDIMGSERGWVINGRFQPDTDSLLNLWRTMSYHKPYCVLQNGDLPSFDHDMVEDYFAYCAFYGIYPSFFTHDGGVSNYWTTPSWYERDRDLYQEYLPVIIALNDAGWEPVTHARTDKPALVYVERYGGGAPLYVTLRNNTEVEQATQVSVDLDELGLPIIDGFLVEDVLQGDGVPATRNGHELTIELTIGAKSTRILSIVLPQGEERSLQLHGGWNLVALPGEPATASAQHLFAPLSGVLDRVFAFDAESDVWLSHQDMAPWACTLTEVGAGQGLWIHVASDVSWPVYCLDTTDVTLSLHQGWNLVGYPLAEWQDLASAAAPIASHLVAVNAYDATNLGNPWSTFVPGNPANTLTQLQPARGYWVQVGADCTWTIGSP